MGGRAWREVCWRLAVAVYLVFGTVAAVGQTSLTLRGAGVQASGAADRSMPSVVAFDVATIKPAAPSPDGHVHVIYPPDGRFSALNISLLALMSWAYDLPEKQILEAPAWVASTRFDVQAKSDAKTDSELRALPTEQGREVKRRMVQGLLVERFNLKLHGETRILPAYDLLLAKGGSKLALSQSSGRSVGSRRAALHDEGVTTDIVAEQLSQVTGRIVIDKTGLTERYDVKLEWTPDDAPVEDNSPPTLFTALQEQLGLRLESAKEPVPVLIIERVEGPTAN